MARFLKIISGLYLVLVWFALVLVISVGDAHTPAETFAAVFAAVSLSIPSAVLFALAQFLEDVRSMRKNLHLQSRHLETQSHQLEAMLAYYESSRSTRQAAKKRPTTPLRSLDKSASG
jgi:TRAP-type C4-dicarboxylate transport system permease small subunit